MLRKVAGWLVLAFLLFYALSNPSGAAGAVRHLVSALHLFASGLAGGGR